MIFGMVREILKKLEIKAYKIIYPPHLSAVAILPWKNNKVDRFVRDTMYKLHFCQHRDLQVSDIKPTWSKATRGKPVSQHMQVYSSLYVRINHRVPAQCLSLPCVL